MTNLWRLAVLGAAAHLVLGCSLVFDPVEPRQCNVDADCVGALQGRVCNAEHGVCVVAGSAATACESTTICTQQNSNGAAVCRVPGESCVRLETPECPRISGDWRDPRAVIIGTVGPQTQVTYRGREPLELPYVPRLSDSIDLAVDEWAVRAPSGLGTFDRPLAVLHCDSSADPLRAERVMEHLIHEVRSPLVMALSDVDLDAVANLASEAAVPLLCVACLARPASAKGSAPVAWHIQPAL